MTLSDVILIITVIVAVAALVFNVGGVIHSAYHLHVLEARRMNGKRRIIALGQRRRYGARASIAVVVILVTTVAEVVREPIVSIGDRTWVVGILLVAGMLLLDALLSRDETRHMLDLYLGKETDRE